MVCDVSETYIETYRGYEVYEVKQVEIGTGKPINGGSKWYKMQNQLTGDSISVMHHWWRVYSAIDYRIKVNPHMFGTAGA